MGLHKGAKTNNPNGRPKGSPNKSTNKLRQQLSMFLDRNLEDLQSDYEVCTPAQKLSFLEKIISYLLPKPQSDLKVEFQMLEQLINNAPAEAAELIAQKVVAMFHNQTQPHNEN